MRLAAYLLVSLQDSVCYAFQQIHRVAYTAIRLNPNNGQRHVTTHMVEADQVQVSITTQQWVQIG